MFDILKNFSLQLFADAGTMVNATGNYVNAYTGETQAFDAANSLSGELKTFYDTELLENARVEMFYAQFGKKQALPANHGTTVEWRKWNTFAPAEQLQEGVIPTGQKFGMSVKQSAIEQYGTSAAIGFSVAIILFAGVRERLEGADIPSFLKGAREVIYEIAKSLYAKLAKLCGAHLANAIKLRHRRC